MMKIDYELVEKIGATHYSDDSLGNYHKTDGSALFRWRRLDEAWERDKCNNGYVLNRIKPIPPKPPVRVEYEKVNFSTVGYFVQSVYDERDKYFYLNKGNGEYNIAEYQDAAWYWKEDNIYRRIEKPVDWRELTIEFADKCGFYGIGAITLHHSDRFLEMCRIALRANGEL
jgi:hypothetical protein